MYQKLHKARQDHLCTGCTEIIEKGTQYYQVGLIPKNKDYHVDCLPKTEPTPMTETKVEPEVKADPVQPRDTNGRFAKKGSDKVKC